MPEPAMTQPAVHQLSRPSLAGFATGSLGMGIWVTVPGLLLLFFLTDVLAVSPTVAGLALLLPKILDVLLHPWVGRLSDADRRRHGHRRRLMLFGCALPVAFALLFAVPGGLTGGSAALWVTAAFVLGNFAFALYQVPYLSTPADLTIGYDERTRLMGFRMVVLTLGILLSGVLAPIIQNTFGYAAMGATLGVGMLATMFIGVRGVRQLTEQAPSPVTGAGHAPGLRALLDALRDKQYRWLVASYLLMSTTSHLVLAAVPYYAAYELGRPKLTTVLVAAFVAPALIATPFWVRLVRRIGKQSGLLIAQGTFVGGCVVLAFGRTAGLAVLIAAVAVLGIAFAAMQLLPFSMVPDVVRAADPDKAGSYLGVWTAAEATGGALGPYVYSACLAIGGFVGSTADEEVVQSAFAHDMIRLGFGLVPAVLMVGSILLQRRYVLDRQLRSAAA
ncbi:Na+/melibiose symporter-like transporter [Hamadaea flava]|uniref:MFS transporter n=1 Tax=Hamadaea flava TaxID=1742688 RepID=A0ABV8LI28_9ACTN|nr:MFS transporter [Hamadaea flava]MCP2325261.1 Na+/melibiose symporter-like transporter [Hamadaea flava]